MACFARLASFALSMGLLWAGSRESPAQDPVVGQSPAAAPDLAPVPPDVTPSEPPSLLGISAEAARLNGRMLDIFPELASRHAGGNFIWSPYGLGQTLGLCSLAARGKTESELVEWLDLPNDRTSRGRVLEEINRVVVRASGGDSIRFAERIWTQDGIEPSNAFRESIRHILGGSAGQADFANHADDARLEINRWVAQQTEGRLTDLLLPEDVSSTTRVLLTTTLNFKGIWEVPFLPALTRKAPFFLGGSADRRVLVPTMSNTACFRYGKFEDCKVLELPYRGRQLAMLILLPPEGKMGNLEASLSDERIGRWVAGLEMTEVNVRLPRFGFDTRLELKDSLRTAGLELPLGDQGDFSGLVEGSGGSSFRLDRVVNQSRVEVDEVGTKASSAIAASWGTRSFPVSFDCNRPFIFLIRDQVGGVALFCGRVADPS